MELFEAGARTSQREDAMKTYLENLPLRTWLVLALSVIALGYPIARMVLPAVVHAVVPEVVQSVLKVI